MNGRGVVARQRRVRASQRRANRGLHLGLVTQRPGFDVARGVVQQCMRGNLPGRKRVRIRAGQQILHEPIDVLELALAEAKAGNVLAVAISLVGPPGPGGANAIGYYSSEVNQLGSPLLASISLTYFRFCQNMWQGDMTEVRTDDLPDPDAS